MDSGIVWLVHPVFPSIVEGILHRKAPLSGVFFCWMDCLQIQIKRWRERFLSPVMDTLHRSFLYDRKIDLYYHLITIPLSLALCQSSGLLWGVMKHEIVLIITEHRSFWSQLPLREISVQQQIFFSSAVGYINVQLNSLQQCWVNLQQEKPGKHPQCRLIMQTARRVCCKFGSRLVFL